MPNSGDMNRDGGGINILDSSISACDGQNDEKPTRVESKADQNPTSLSTSDAAQAAEKRPWIDDGPIASSCSSPVKEGSEANRLDVPKADYRAWLVVVGGFINFTIVFGLLNSFGTFQAYYESKWPGTSTATITWIGSVQLCLFFLGGLFVGPAYDKYGARSPMLLGTACSAASFLFTSWSTVYWHYLLAQGFLFGAGSALLFYPCTGAISEWFNEKRGLALGIAVSGSSLGGVFWPILLNKLFDTVPEEVVYRIILAISTPLLLVSCFLIRERKGLAEQDTCSDDFKNLQASLSKAIMDWRFLALSGCLMVLYAGMLIPFYYIPLYAVERGIDQTMANNLLAISYAGSFFSRIGAGWLADNYGRFNILIIVGAAMSLVTCGWIWIGSMAAMVVFSILFGMFSGGLVPLGSACVAQTTSNMGYIGLRIGVMMAISSIGALAGGPISGVIRDGPGGWIGVHAFSACLSMTGAALLLAVRWWHKPSFLAKF